MRLSTMIGVTIAILLALPAGAQPTIERSATAMASAPLPVLDDYGEPITEEAIAAAVRPKGKTRKLLYPLLGILAGMSLMDGSPGMYRDCSIYEPCSDKDRFYQTFGFAFGAVAGGLLGYAIPAGEVTRLEAVQRIRAARRQAREGQDP